jgi:hypothetical protein
MLSAVLLDVQRRLESLYALDPEPPVSDFLVDEDAPEANPPGSRTLVAQQGDELRVGVVLDGGVREGVARADPRVRLDQRNLAALCTLTEEVSHFLYVLFCARCGRSITQLELELQGEVDKYLTAVSLLSVQNEGAVSRRLRDLLFRGYRLRQELRGDEAERYRAASRLAWTYCGYLESEFLRCARLLDLRREARRFYRLGQQDKLLRIAALPAA